VERRWSRLEWIGVYWNESSMCNIIYTFGMNEITMRHPSSAAVKPLCAHNVLNDTVPQGS